MKFTAYLIFTIFFCTSGVCQTDSSIYKTNPVIPLFKIYTVPDSIVLTANYLNRKKPVMFILFSPDCEHCKTAFKDLATNIELFRRTQIIMVSASGYEVIRQFYVDNQVSRFKNITIGSDPSDLLSTFFDSRRYPAVFVYKKGKLKIEERGQPDFKKIALRAEL
jgi:thiol-disulfide isomerase/thioredoxin